MVDGAYSVISAPRGWRADETLARTARRLGYPGIRITSSDLFFVRGCDTDLVRTIAARLIDEHLVFASTVEDVEPEIEKHVARSGGLTVEVALRSGVTDRVAAQLVASAALMGVHVEAATGSRYRIEGVEDSDLALTHLVASLLSNPVIETWSTSRVRPGFLDTHQKPNEYVEIVPIRELAPDELANLNARRGLALDPEELLVVRDFYAGIDRDPTEAELETIAQTWSEHCAHKTFTARIDIDGNESPSLLKQLRACTSGIAAPFVVSAFDGNAGVVKFGSLPALAIKAETHNHPSAVEPFGGANTGVGGVVRDVLAAPARPVALTDVLCFGPRDLPAERVPHGVLHPSVIEEGVVAGVADYGNKIGVPTVAGAVLYDEGYVGNPLVFCGCVGEVLSGYPRIGAPRVGDRVVVIGGATGRDGIKGATFSSMTMDATTGSVAGASVQIGDPIVERLVGEVLIELLDREQPLCTALTDCGAGGLSSAVGEMAEKLGATVHLEAVSRKYPGLAPWEVWLSEAQERMVLAVDPVYLNDVLAACRRRGVGVADIGTFTGSGRMVVLHGRTVVVDLPTSFMHSGRPQRRMSATLRDRSVGPARVREIVDHNSTLLALLSHPTIASKEGVVRRYDHQILGATIVGPMSAPFQTGPSDGVVLVEPRAAEGFALGIGLNPQYGLFDTEEMAWAAVDEAVRNVVAAGADPEAVALLDNFSWGDPRRADVMGDLVLAVRGCCDAAVAYRAPFVSGKDSLNNEFEGLDGVRRSIPPTLVITALAHVPDADVVVDSTLNSAGTSLVLIGGTRDELRGSHLDLVLGADHGGSVPRRDLGAPARYVTLHRLIRRGLVKSAHDVSEGGLAVCLAEYVLGAAPGLAVQADLSAVHHDVEVALYSESVGRIVVEVSEQDLEEVVGAFGADGTVIGHVVEGAHFVVRHGEAIIDVAREKLSSAWNSLLVTM